MPFQRWFIVFPGFPAVLLLPVVWVLGGAEHVADGAVFLLLAGLAPSGLYLTLHRIQRAKITELSPAAMLVWPVLYAIGSVYFFTAVQGTVWFAAHVITDYYDVLFPVGEHRSRTSVRCRSDAFCRVRDTHPPGLFGRFFLFRILSNDVQKRRLR